jgi:hypothetical protein
LRRRPAGLCARAELGISRLLAARASTSRNVSTIGGAVIRQLTDGAIARFQHLGHLLAGRDTTRAQCLRICDLGDVGVW